ncbi:MAG: CRISPR-associated helicase Cas3' [Tessaracoccus sp.]|uniref:CRISPR-associated helicase Cas3' n=1 Tax=Tessaracoccus sp. TaxID=1971211 RepID=UPI001EC24C62|nr:CRISPR-associated helicase Cas3' [Tessaracoccus sp.]MBK7821948.1 CRISPR-associated helicase Cas3' [Tessaracoccus sp.]
MTSGLATDGWGSAPNITHPPPLSTSVWAKTGGADFWQSLPQHLADTRTVAELLYEHWLSRSVKERWVAEPPGADGMRTIALFLAATHDVGKAAPAFVAQSEPLAQLARDTGLTCHTIQELRDDRRELPHSLIGQHAATRWLETKGVDEDAAKGLASVIGAHHGRPVQHAPRLHSKRPNGMGRDAWEKVRFGLLDWQARETGFDELLRAGGQLSVSLPTLIEITGFVIVADWLASNTALFPLRPRGRSGEVEADMPARTAVAWGEIAMPPPWQPPRDDSPAPDFFRSRFGWEPTVTPHAMQTAALDAARTVDIGLMLIETETGGGKTEAALAAAESIASRRGSQGIVIALPTQATTNAMFSRVARWIDDLPEPPAEVGAWALTLGHGKSQLNQEFAKLNEAVKAFERRLARTEEHAPIFEGEETPALCNAVVHQWFLGAKRRLLSNFAVVTIDQVLRAALQRKHLMLDHLALGGKVVIIDEAHASDDFMNVYLDSALSWLGAYDVPVILLSATLTAERRRRFLSAYRPGRAAEAEKLSFAEDDYPLLTILPRDEAPITARVVAENRPGRSVQWTWHPTALDRIVASVRDDLAHGGCALVVRNTVKDAQATAAALEEAGIAVLLTHAGFLAVDRAGNDEELRYLFGKDGVERPDRIAVVSTQVVEQSLDVDFDVLYTDLAPVDLLLQRVGRLHRHARIRPHRHATARLFLLADLPSDDALPSATPGSLAVYGSHLLLRTAATLVEHGPTIRIPDDVARLVERALGSGHVGREAWQAMLSEARANHEREIEKQREKAAKWCVVPWNPDGDPRTSLGDWLTVAPDSSEIAMGIAVRDTDPTLEVIVVPIAPAGSAVRPPWLTKNPSQVETLDTSTRPSDEVAREVAGWAVRLPTAMTRWDLDDVVTALDRDPATRRWAWRQHPLLKGELFLPMNQPEEGSTTLMTELSAGRKHYRLTYSPTRGLEVSDA